MAKAKLKELVEGLEMQSLEVASYLNTRTGEVVTLTDEEMGWADGLDDDAPDWMKDAADLADKVLNSGDYIQVPDEWELDEYRIMADFCWRQPEGEVQEDLLAAIRGKGAFRRFKDTAEELGVISEWFEYRSARFEAFAAQWCADNDIEVE